MVFVFSFCFAGISRDEEDVNEAWERASAARMRLLIVYFNEYFNEASTIASAADLFFRDRGSSRSIFGLKELFFCSILVGILFFNGCDEKLERESAASMRLLIESFDETPSILLGPRSDLYFMLSSCSFLSE